MTLLASITSHELHFFCTCGNNRGVTVADLLEAGHPRDTTVESIRRRMRCSRCGRKGEAEVRIVYAITGRPLEGTRTRKDGESGAEGGD